MDLIVWLDADDRYHGFQLYYDKPLNEHALIWKGPHEVYHYRVDDGESAAGRYKQAPLLVADGMFDAERVVKEFRGGSAEVEVKLREFVLHGLERLAIERRQRTPDQHR
jgi:hypothetical protein